MYYLLYGLLYVLSLLPLRVLYLISNFIFFIVYHVTGYRKMVVMQNLTLAFPQKSETEKITIAKQFYLNFTDTLIETIKLVSASNNYIKKHLTGDFKLIDELYHKGKKVQLHLGHNFNWELGLMALPLYTPFQTLAVYMPINNKAIDRLFLKIRSGTGARMLPATKINLAFLPFRNDQYLMALVADQNPGIPSRGYWVNFFGKATPFVKGPEKNARANNTAVVFAHMTKPRRGYYEVSMTLACENALSMSVTELTANYIEYLEKVITAHPEMWLWSHRRWKHEWKPEYGEVIR